MSNYNNLTIEQRFLMLTMNHIEYKIGKVSIKVLRIEFFYLSVYNCIKLKTTFTDLDNIEITHEKQ